MHSIAQREVDHFRTAICHYPTHLYTSSSHEWHFPVRRELNLCAEERVDLHHSVGYVVVVQEGSGLATIRAGSILIEGE